MIQSTKTASTSLDRLSLLYCHFALVATALFAVLLAVPLAAQEPDDDTPRWSVDVESSSHIVRREAERINFRYQSGEWRYVGLLASLTPRFGQSRDEIGALVARDFGDWEFAAALRFTDKPVGEDIVGSVWYERRRGESSAWGVDLTFAQADLADDAFLFDDDESQLYGRIYWQAGNGFEISAFVADKGTFDLMRGTLEILERLPRSEMVGAETLADLYIDEGRLEDSAGVRVGREHDKVSWSAYFKSGEQLLPGFFDGDDFDGFGGDLDLEIKGFELRTELDLRTIDAFGSFGSLERGRFFADLRHEVGRFEWGVGGFVQGEGTFDEIPDVFDTAGLGFTAAWDLGGERQAGFWSMFEEDGGADQRITRLGLFLRRGSREYGVGLRRDEETQAGTVDETVGAFVFGDVRLGQLAVKGDLGFQDSDVYGKLSLAARF